MASNMSRKDPAWKHGERVTPERAKKGYIYVRCKYCDKVISGGIQRLKSHLAWTHKDVAPCPQVPDDVKEEVKKMLTNFQAAKQMSQMNFQENVDGGVYFGGGQQTTGTRTGSVNPASGSRGVRGPMDRFVNIPNDEDELPAGETMSKATAKELRNQVCMDIGRFFYENGISFNVANSPSYAGMVRSIGNYGRGLKPPSMHDLRTWILKEEVNTTTAIVDEIKATWKKTGVSLLSDGWSDMRNRSLINFLVNNPHGTVFLKTIDASDCIKNAEKLFEMLDGVIEEIGGDIVVQVVTDNASAYKAAGALLMAKRKSLYWTPCAAHCIDLMLEKIGELTTHKTALTRAKKVSNFIYNHQWVLSLARKHLGKDLLRPAATRFATAFLTIQSMYESKQELQQMFISSEWASCAWAKKSDGKEVKNIVMDDRVFWPSVVYCLKTTAPLVEVLRIVDGEQMPAMAFIYGAMDECKEKIARSFDNNVSSYKEIWEIIDAKWELQMHRDLHAAAYYLNPRYRWSPNVSEHPEIKRGLYACLAKLVDDRTYMKIDAQFVDYNTKQGLLGYRGALATYMTHPPVQWWQQYGDEVPELRDFAMKILGLTCSASACERNWSTFNQVHTKRRNRLNTDRMNKLVYIMYNKKLKQKFIKKKNLKDGEDPLVVEEASSDDEWLANPSGDYGDDVSSAGASGGTGSGGTGGDVSESSSRARRSKKRTLHLVDEDEDEDEDDDDFDGLHLVEDEDED